VLQKCCKSKKCHPKKQKYAAKHICAQSINYHIIHLPQQQYCANGQDFRGIAGNNNYINAPAANFGFDHGLHGMHGMNDMNRLNDLNGFNSLNVLNGSYGMNGSYGLNGFNDSNGLNDLNGDYEHEVETSLIGVEKGGYGVERSYLSSIW